MHIYHYNILAIYNSFSFIQSMDSSIKTPQISSSGKQTRRPMLKIHEERGTLTIQTEQLAIQAIFSSPILQAANYIEQVEKYSLRAALSGLNLKVDEYDAHYTRIKQKIDETYSTLTYKSIAMIQDLLIALRLLKIEMWREQTAVANGIRTHLYQKSLDPYLFNPSQFDADIANICENKNNSFQDTFIEELSQRLKQHQAQKMEEMFSGKVVQPFLAQNKDRNEVVPASIYASLLNQIKLKMEKNDQVLLKKHSAIQEQIVKFMQSISQHNIRVQKLANFYIKRYNQLPSEGNNFMLHSIVPIVELNQRIQTVDADDLFTNKQYRSQLRPAFANRIHNVQFKNVSKIFDPQTGNLTQVQCKQSEINHRQWDRYGGIESPLPRSSPFDSFSERKKNNPKEFYQLRQFQKQKYREEELRLRERDRSDRQRDKEKEKMISKKIIRTITTPPAWIQLAEHESPLFYFYMQRRQKEHAIWDNKQKGSQWEEITYSLKYEKVTQTPLFRTAQDKNKYEQEQRREEEVQSLQKEQSFINYQIKRREEESVRMVRLQKLIESRTYEKFINLSKLQLRVPPFCDNHAISRYGITFNVNFDRSRELKDIDRFFYLYFKERYYKQNDNIRENADNPIIFLDSSKINMDSPSKIVSQYIGSIVKRVDSLPFFLVWGEDILVYRSKVSKEGKVGYFELYPFVYVANSQKLMYELRRRVQIAVKEEIKDKYCSGSQLERIYSRVEVAHRAIFDRHRQLPDLTSSILKGRQLVNQIFESLRNGRG